MDYSRIIVKGLEVISDIVDLLKVISPVIIAVGSIWFGYFLRGKEWKKQKTTEYIDRQLREFYSPLLACRKEIEALSNLRVKIGQKTAEYNRESFEKGGELSHEERIELGKELGSKFDKQISYENEQFKEKVLSLYERMLEIFSNNIHLAEPSTLKYYEEFYEFVEIWRRCFADGIIGEVVEKIGHDEGKLKLFYLEIRSQFENLRNKLSDG